MSGLAFPLYTAIVLVGLGLAMGWALDEAGLPERTGWLAGMVVLNCLLWCQYVPDHGNWLWRAGWPAYHGGTVVNGFLVLALVLRAMRLGGWTRGRRIALIAVMTAGLLSNALIFFHWILPVGVVLAWQGRRGPTAGGFAKQYGLVVLQAFALMAAVPHIDRNALEFPRPAGAEALKAFCKEHGLRQGVGDYWSGHYLTAVWRHEGPLLGSVFQGGGTYFWCNNVFGYFPPGAEGRGLTRPEIQFVVMERLDRHCCRNASEESCRS